MFLTPFPLPPPGVVDGHRDRDDGDVADSADSGGAHRLLGRPASLATRLLFRRRIPPHSSLPTHEEMLTVVAGRQDHLLPDTGARPGPMDRGVDGG